MAAPVAPALADAPATPKVEAFDAELCEGGTAMNPLAESVGGEPLNAVFGERLSAYNAGSIVPLYGTNGKNEPSTPNCGVRHVEGKGAVSEWTYCTDLTLHTCSVTDDQGRLTHRGGVVGAPEPVDANADLTEDDHRVIAYIVTKDMQTTPLPAGYSGASATTASNKTAQTRAVRQQLVWCVSDADRMHHYPGMGGDAGWCAKNVGEEQRAAILATYSSDPVLEISPASTDAGVQDSATLELTTNLLNQPITLTAEGGSLELCEAQDGVKLEDGTLTISGDQQDSATAQLCATGAPDAQVTVNAAAQALGEDVVAWSQSPKAARDGGLCQVYASVNTGGKSTVTADATVTFAGKEPEVPAEDPEVPADEPEVPAEDPEVPVEQPEVPAEKPEVPAEEPEVPAEEPEVPADEPEVLAEDPEVPAEEHEVPAEQPEVPAEEPEVPAEQPEVPVEETETPEQPEGSDAPKVAGQDNGQTLARTGATSVVEQLAAAFLLMAAGTAAAVVAKRRRATK